MNCFPRVLASSLALLIATTSLLAQSPAASSATGPAASSTAPLLPPAGLSYRYWPMQLVQFVGDELPYSMILLYVDDRQKEPSYDATLTDRASGKRTHYANKPELLAEDKARGDDAYLTRIEFDQPAAPGKGAQYLLRFATERGAPVLWQFVQGTDISEQGSGVSPVDAPIPVIQYREQGALAGEGTALKIGSVTSTADVWKEYAQPPYFIPYHGAISSGVHTLSMVPVHSVWTDAQPASIADGGNWKLQSAAGTTLTARADALKGSVLSIDFLDEAHGTTMTVEAQQAVSGWTMNRVRFGPVNAKPEHTVSIVFAPALAAGSTSRFDIVAGKKSKLASGTVDTSAGEGGALTEKWAMTAPDWAKGKSATATASLQH